MMSSTRDAEITWEGKLLFRGGAPGKPTSLLDGNSEEAPSPVVTLLLAGAACAASDTVLILEKMRVELASLRVLAHGVRRDEEPRRFERAVNLSVEKYCSVLASLAPDIEVTHEIRLV
jgi:putative redox protein